MMVLGRKIGWELSKQILYKSGRSVCCVCCIVWGAANAQGIHSLIHTWHPGLLLKIFGYGAGVYVSVPNYGLFNEGTLPDSLRGRHLLIQVLPDVTYLVGSILFVVIPS